MNDKTRDELFLRQFTKDSIREAFEQTFEARVGRWEQVKPLKIVPYTHFSAVSAECRYLFRDGYFYGCIALTQGVAEALERFICQKNHLKINKSFENNVERLAKGRFISNEAKRAFINIWENRDAYHHLNPNIEADRLALERLAKEKLLFLNQIEEEVFGFKLAGGTLVPNQPKYWDIKDGKSQAFLR